MINPLSLRSDLAHTMSTVDNKTDEGLLQIILTAFMPNNEFNVEAQLAFVMTMTLAVTPTIEGYTVYDEPHNYLRSVHWCWEDNKFNDCFYDFISKTEHQALDEAYLVLHHCQKILKSHATFGCFEGIVDLVTQGYAILPAVHPEETEMLRSWMFDEVIPYCAAGALPPFIYTVHGIEPTAAALKELLRYH